jgi:Protein of unknown function (DUF2752)
MRCKPHQLYLLLLVGCLAGYAWLLYTAAHPHNELTVCLVKNTTGLPCPSCGSTRAVVALLQGDWYGAIQWNPLGVLIALILLVAPVWIGFDMRSDRTTFHAFALRSERFFQHRWVAAPAVILLLLNWIWTLSKGL